MTQIIFTGAAGFLFLVGFSLFFVWLDERSKKRHKQKQSSRFRHFDKYYSELERESEKQLERKRQERLEIMGYSKEVPEKESENIDVTRFSGNAAL